MSSFLDFSAKVGQSEAPSSLMTLILRPSTPPMALIWSMASCSAWMEPVSEMAMVPVAECSWPTVTSVSVTASLVVLTWAVGWAKDQAGRPAIEAAPMACSRRRRPPSVEGGRPRAFGSVRCFMVKTLLATDGLGWCAALAGWVAVGAALVPRLGTTLVRAHTSINVARAYAPRGKRC